MNKHFYKTIFSKARGEMIAVAEHVSAAGQSTTQNNKTIELETTVITSKKNLGLKVLSFSLMLITGTALISSAVETAQANVIADPNAAGNQRPTVLSSANGTTQVNIQTPTQAGVSMNHYQQFDVNQQGVILNNSRQNTNTQLGGYIQANPWLAGGEAKVIVNQVNSSNPSHLNGYIEVGGRKADVIIANQAGINVDGGGFINTGGVTLSSGNPRLNNGQVTGFQIRDGLINITGQGLDTSKTDYTQILSRAASINAGIWANELTVVTGQNDIAGTAQIGSVQATATSTGTAPQVAIDTSNLGGMYAGKISLISTEKGVGINNAGQVFASAGNIKISANGEVLNSGAVVAQDKTTPNQATLEIKGTDLNNSGTFSSLGQQSIQTENIKNTGLITTSAELNIRNSNRIQNSGDLNAGRVDIETTSLKNQSGNIIQTGLQDLTIEANTLSNSQNGLIGYTEVDTSGGTSSGSNTGNTGSVSTGSGNSVPTTAAGGGRTSSANTSIATSFAQGSIQANQIENDAGKITANGGISLNLDKGLDNQNAQLNLNTLNVSGEQFNNIKGDIYTQNSHIDVGSADNSRGKLQVEQNLNLNSGQFINQDGQILAGTTLLINSGDINNQQGKLLSSQDIAIQAQNINNRDGQVLANQDVDIQAKSITADGELAAGHDLALTLKHSFTTQNNISAGNQLSIETAGDLINSTELRAGNKLSLQAQTIENTANGRLVAENKIHIGSENLINRGEINSNGQSFIEVNQQLNNIGTGKIYGHHVAIAANELINQNEIVSDVDKAAVIAARQQLDIGAQQISNKEGALLSSEGNMVIAGQLSRTKNAEGQAKNLNNHSAKIEAGNDLTINSQVVRHTNQHLKTEIKEVDRQHIIEYEVQGQNKRYAAGSQEELGWGIKRTDENDHMVTPDGIWHENWHKYDYDKITEQTQVIDSAPGQMIAGGNIKITGTSLLNADSQILAGKTLVVSVDDLVNHETLGQTIVTDQGTLHSYWREHHSGADSTGHDTSSYRPAPMMTDLNLGIFSYQEHAQIQNNSGSTEALNISSAYQDGIGIRTGDVNTTLPNSSLFSVNPNNGQYLINTDPSFTNYKKWLGSDYMLQMFNSDPQNMHKRLGDGYYEQKLVNDQIAKLTGQVYLDGYNNLEDQFKALMDSGMSAAKEMNLSVGVALSAEQIARLTTDIVWLVEQKITLADGRVETVLVPQVYVRLQSGDINGSGALLAGSNTALNVTNHLENSGTIAGRNALVIQADRIDNLGGRITANQLSAKANTDINNVSGVIDAKQQLFLDAGRDINIVTQTNTTKNEQGSNTHLNRQAGVYVTNAEGEGILSLKAGQDIHLKAGVISNASQEGVTQLDAKNNIHLGTVTVAQQQENIRDANNYVKRSESGEVGSQILANNDIQLKAGQDIQLRASEINSGQGNVVAQAQNIKVESGEYTKTADDATQSNSKGLLSSSTYTYKDSASNTQAVASVIGGKNIALQAEQDIGIKGSHVIADQDTQLTAKNNISIESATTSSTEDHFFSKEKSGLFSSGGIGFTVGKVKESTDNENQRKTSTASTVGSLNGNTKIVAGKNYQQTGSTVSAQNGDVNIIAQQVNIEAAAEQQQNDYLYEREQKGFTLAVNIPVVAAIQTAVNATQQIGKSKNDRVNAMAAANAGFDAYKAGQSLAQLKDAATSAQNLADAANVSVSLTYGEQKDTSFSHTESTTGASSQVYAGGKTNIIAHSATATSCETAEQCSADRSSGAGEQSDINIVGSDVLGKQGTNLIADNDINIKAFEQNSVEESGNKSQGWNVGVAVSYGKSGLALGVTAGGNLGKGSDNGEETSYLNSHVGSQESQTVINSGNATNIIGGQVQGKGVSITAKELNIESLQDKATYEAKQQNISAQATVGYGASVSGSFSKSDIDANYASVSEQSGIYAGDDGYQIKVQNNTNLKGAIITSTQKAEDAGKNALSTGTLTASDIKNVSEYDAKGIGLSGSMSVSGDRLGQKAPSQEQGVVLNNEGNRGSGTSVGLGIDSESDSSVTQSGINTKNIKITDEQGQQALTGQSAEQAKEAIHTNITTDNAKENSGVLKNNFNKDKVLSEIDLQVDVTQQFDANRQEVKQQLYAVVDQKKAEATAIRKENGGYDTDVSKQLDLEANKLNEITRWVDIGLGAVWGLGDTTALTGMYLTTQADRVQRAINTPNEMWFQTCSAPNEECQSRQIFSLDDLTPEEKLQLQIDKSIVTISNPGIFNDRDDALKNASKQNITSTNQSGIVVVMNPPTGKYDSWWITTSLVSELMYAGYDKFNDIIGGYLPLSNSEKLNQDLYNYAKLNSQTYFENRNPLELDLNSHSRGGLTSSVALQDLNNNQNILGIPIRQSRFDGTATNVQDYANQLYKNGYISKDGYYSSAYSAVHKSDPVGSIPGILGGNQRLPGNCFWCYSHSSYFAEIPPQQIRVNGEKVDNELYKDYVKKWGEVDANNPINKSAPVLIRPNVKGAEEKYFNEKPY
ncbi:hemagglutinin repeat-containing protein [Acinetobacter sp. SAAs470]|nr:MULTISPECIES: hemagglutinin repeat-containing protein [unclassified Acinetobacter]WOE32914.1 hemagglutinin repeat-containing protein [Acinetobacter sp. SAAs470]WOE38391.1 hemagglutinin repeat-containing protein [Acinetobacter sp. SAAs474]